MVSKNKANWRMKDYVILFLGFLAIVGIIAIVMKESTVVSRNDLILCNDGSYYLPDNSSNSTVVFFKEFLSDFGDPFKVTIDRDGDVCKLSFTAYEGFYVVGERYSFVNFESDLSCLNELDSEARLDSCYEYRGFSNDR